MLWRLQQELSNAPTLALAILLINRMCARFMCDAHTERVSQRVRERHTITLFYCRCMSTRHRCLHVFETRTYNGRKMLTLERAHMQTCDSCFASSLLITGRSTYAVGKIKQSLHSIGRFTCCGPCGCLWYSSASVWVCELMKVDNGSVRTRIWNEKETEACCSDIKNIISLA